MKVSRKVGGFLFLGAAVVCLAIGTAKAQEISQCAFTLQHATQWGKHVLPEGTYKCTVQQMDDMRGATVTISGVNDSSQEIQVVGFGRIPESSLKGAKSTLMVSRRGDIDAVRGIYLADRGVEYTFPVHTKHKALMAQQREETLRIPVRTAGN